MEALQHPQTDEMSLVIWQKPLRPEATPREQLEQLGEAIAELSAHIDAATYRLLRMIADFDRRTGWSEGFKSCAHWLSWRVGWSSGTARERVRVARALEELPLISEALQKGQISYSKVRAMTRIARPDNEHELLILGKDGTAGHVERLVRYYRKYGGDEEQQQGQRQRERQYLQTYTDDDGMVVVKGRLPPEVGALLQQALDAAADALHQQERDSQEDTDETDEDACCHGCNGESLQDVNRMMRVEALGLVARQALTAGMVDGEAESGTRGRVPRNLLVVHVDANVLADPRNNGKSYIEEVGNVPAGTSRRLGCDAQVVEVVEDEQGHVLDVGRKSRRVTERLARALRERDQTCRFPGCDRTRHLQVHHIEHWANGGETNLSNLIAACSYCHGLLHEGGFSVEGSVDAPVFRNPRGEPIEPSPPLPTPPRRPADALVSRNRQEGLDITPETNRITWAGQPVEYGWAVEALMPRGLRLDFNCP